MKAEKPELSREDGGGTAGAPGSERQATTACDEHTDEQEVMTIEEVLRRGNMLRAYQRVKRNKGSAGVDGMTVDELMPYLRSHWSRISIRLLPHSKFHISSCPATTLHRPLQLIRSY